MASPLLITLIATPLEDSGFMAGKDVTQLKQYIGID